MSNIHTQVLTSVRGLSGLTEVINGGLSFLDRVVRDAASRTRDQYTSAASSLLSNAIITESEYNTARKASQDRIDLAVRQLQTNDETCWGALVAQAKVDLLSDIDAAEGSVISTTDTTVKLYGDPVTDTDEVTVDINITASGGGNATSVILLRTTKYYLDVVISEISQLLGVIRQNVSDSDAALANLTNLQMRLSQAQTKSETRQVLSEIDQLVAGGTLHKTADVYIAQDQHSQLLTYMADIVTQTSESWSQSWCDPENWRDQIKD
jgi:hypothetical protein